MTIPVGTKVRTLVPLGPHPAGTETYVLAGAGDTVDGYKNPIGLVGRTFGEAYEYALDLHGFSKLPVLVDEREVEVIE